MRTCFIIVAVLASLTACSETREPEPSALFDGRYIGSRHAAPVETCATRKPDGTTSAEVSRGEVSIPLFGPKSLLRGTVGADGRVRASGMWTRSDRYFPRMTVFNGQIDDGILLGRATDMQCVTDVRLHKVVPRKSPPIVRHKR